jgi:ribonuclease E
MAAKKKKRKMFLSVLPGEQIELALVEDALIEEYFVDILHHAKTKGNIYKGYIHNIDAGLQAAFINYGHEKNGFLQIDEVHPEYYQGSYQVPKKARFPLIQKVLKPGQEILVQVVKEPTRTKGAFLTTYLSLPGRCFVLTPGREQLGVSRKIEDDKERERLKKLLEKVDPGPGIGLIVRTACSGQTQTSLQNDLQYLKRLWKEIRKRGQDASPPALVYQEMDLSSRAVRDYLTTDIAEIWVDDPETADELRELAALVFPRRANMIKVHSDPEISLFDRFNLRKQLDQIYSRTVSLPSGGQIIFDHAEALTAVDINSGKIAGKKNFKEMALRNNIESAEMIAKQLRLRDIGGQVVIDFIEMKDKNHQREVEKTMRAALKNDRARTDVGRISRFGLMELVRQRMGSSALSSTLETCPCCEGMGVRRNMEWQAMQALKEIYRLLRAGDTPSPLVYKTNQELADYLLNHKRQKIAEFEERFGAAIRVVWG